MSYFTRSCQCVATSFGGKFSDRFWYSVLYSVQIMCVSSYYLLWILLLKCYSCLLHNINTYLVIFLLLMHITNCSWFLFWIKQLETWKSAKKNIKLARLCYALLSIGTIHLHNIWVVCCTFLWRYKLHAQVWLKLKCSMMMHVVHKYKILLNTAACNIVPWDLKLSRQSGTSVNTFNYPTLFIFLLS